MECGGDSNSPAGSCFFQQQDAHSLSPQNYAREITCEGLWRGKMNPHFPLKFTHTHTLYHTCLFSVVAPVGGNRIGL